MPTPHVKNWVKTTSYGDYRDPQQNHKIVNRNTEQYHLVNFCKRFIFIKKAGSKNLKALRSHVK